MLTLYINNKHDMDIEVYSYNYLKWNSILKSRLKKYNNYNIQISIDYLYDKNNKYFYTFPMLNNLSDLIIMYCYIFNINKLYNLKKLHIYYSMVIKISSKLIKLKQLMIHDSKKITYIPFIKTLEILTVEHCANIIKLHFYPNLINNHNIYNSIIISKKYKYKYICI